MHITALGHAGIATHDLDACRRFYAEVLGMQLLPAQEDDGLCFRVNECGQFFVRKADDVPIANVSSNRMRHIAFIVGNTPMRLEEAARHLDSYQIEYRRVAHEEHESLYCRDPDGHLIELYYWPSW